MTRLDSQNKLLRIWVGGFLVFLVVSIVTADGSPTIVLWYLPAVLPTVGALVGARVAEAQSKPKANPKQGQKVDPMLHQIGLALTIVYFLLLAWVLFSSDRPAQMELSGAYLGPLQGLIIGVLGAFFLLQPKPEEGGD